MRDTNVHRRIEWIRVDVQELHNIAKHAKDDLVPGAIAGFFLSGSLWTAVAEVIDKKEITDGAFALFCVSLLAGGVVWWSWQKLSAGSTRVKQVLASIEGKEEVQQ